MAPKSDILEISLFDIGNNIRKWRLIKGLKQGTLADSLGISKVAVSKIETGKTNIPILRFLAIAKALDLTVDLLMRDPCSIIISSNLLVN